MKRYGRVAAEAVKGYLEERSHEPTVLLYSVSAAADEAARNAGRKSELYESLFGYIDLLPPGTRTGWVGSTYGDGFYMVFNPFNPDSATVKTYEPIAGPFDAAVDLGPSTPPRMPASMDSGAVDSMRMP